MASRNLHILPMYISAVFKTHITSSELCMGPVAVEVLVLCTCEGKLNCVPSARQRPISVQKGQAASKKLVVFAASPFQRGSSSGEGIRQVLTAG